MEYKGIGNENVFQIATGEGTGGGHVAAAPRPLSNGETDLTAEIEKNQELVAKAMKEGSLVVPYCGE